MQNPEIYLTELIENPYLIREEHRLTNSIFCDSQNNIYLPTNQAIYILSLRKKAKNKNWIKHYIELQTIISQYKGKNPNIKTFLDVYTNTFNFQKDIKFLNYVSDNKFDSNTFRERLVYLNSFNSLSLQIKQFAISDFLFGKPRKPLLSVSLNNGEAYVLGLGDEIISKYEIRLGINHYLIEKGLIEQEHEFETFGWSKPIGTKISSIEFQMFGCVFGDKIFLWYVTNEENSDGLKFLKGVQVENLKKANKVFIYSCFEKTQIHILISTFQLGLILLDVEWTFDNGEIQITNTKQKSLGKYDKIMLAELLEDKNQTKANDCCNCNVLFCSSNKLFTTPLQPFNPYFLSNLSPADFYSSLLQFKKNQFFLTSIKSSVQIIRNNMIGKEEGEELREEKGGKVDEGGEVREKTEGEKEEGCFKKEEREEEEGEDINGNGKRKGEGKEEERRRKRIGGIKKKITKLKKITKSGEGKERGERRKEEKRGRMENGLGNKEYNIFGVAKKREEGMIKEEDEEKNEEEVFGRKEEGGWRMINESQGWKEEGRIENYSRLRSIKSVCTSANGLLHIISADSGCENPKRTSIYIMRVGRREINGEDILLSLLEKLKSMIKMTDEGFVELKKGIDFGDLMFLISKNFDKCKELLNLLMSIYDEGFAQKFRNKKKWLNRKNLINMQNKIDKVVKEVGLKSFLIEKIFLNVLLLIKNEFPPIVNELIIKIQAEFYRKVLVNEEFKKLSNNNEFYLGIKNNLNCFLAQNPDKNLYIKSEAGEETENKKNKIKEEIKVIRCIFTQEEIKEQKAWRCKACENFGIDFKEIIFYVQKKICPICWNLMKKY